MWPGSKLWDSWWDLVDLVGFLPGVGQNALDFSTFNFNPTKALDGRQGTMDLSQKVDLAFLV